MNNRNAHLKAIWEFGDPDELILAAVYCSGVTQPGPIREMLAAAADLGDTLEIEWTKHEQTQVRRLRVLELVDDRVLGWTDDGYRCFKLADIRAARLADEVIAAPVPPPADTA